MTSHNSSLVSFYTLVLFLSLFVLLSSEILQCGRVNPFVSRIGFMDRYRWSSTSSSEEERLCKTTIMKPVILSKNPLIKFFRNCITTQQQLELLSLAKERLTKETESGFSSSLYLRNKSDANLKILRHVAMLAGNLSGLPWKLAEPVSLTKYKPSQNYGLHFDSGFMMHGKEMKRTATFLLYLNSVTQGGETVFPYASNESVHSLRLSEKPPLKETCFNEQVLRVSPEAKSCLLFFNHLTDDTLNTRAIHGSCPVINGEKWIAQIWLHDKAWGAGVTDMW